MTPPQNLSQNAPHKAEQTRRGILAAGLWALPAVSVVAAAPAFATSGSTFRGLLPQANMLRSTRFGADFSYVPAGAAEPVTMTITRSPAGVALPEAEDDTYLVMPDTELGTGAAIVLHQRVEPIAQTAPTDAVYRYSAMVHTVTFTPEVTNLNITVGGLVTVRRPDDAGGWREVMSDGVDVEPRPSSDTVGTGVGRVADAVSGGESIPGFLYGTDLVATPASRVDYAFAGPVSQLVVRHIPYSRYGGGAPVDQRISLSNISFEVALASV